MFNNELGCVLIINMILKSLREFEKNSRKKSRNLREKKFPQTIPAKKICGKKNSRKFPTH